MAGGWNRMLAGMPLIMMTARGPGHIAFSADKPGETLAVPLQHNQAVDVVEHRFLVATGNVTYQWENSGIWFTTQNGDDQEYHYPLGQTMDRFWAKGGPGLLLLHAPGNTFVRDLAPGERILIQPSGLIWKDPTVRMTLHFEYPHGAYWFSSARWQAKSAWLSLHGPGPGRDPVRVRAARDDRAGGPLQQRDDPGLVAEPGCHVPLMGDIAAAVPGGRIRWWERLAVGNRGRRPILSFRSVRPTNRCSGEATGPAVISAAH